MNLPPVVSPAEWNAAREELLEQEKAQTRARDALAAERRRLPIVYHFMWESIEDPTKRCNGCSMFVDNLGHPAHLHARDTSLVLVSRDAPVPEIEEFEDRMGWTL